MTLYHQNDYFKVQKTHQGGVMIRAFVHPDGNKTVSGHDRHQPTGDVGHTPTSSMKDVWLQMLFFTYFCCEQGHSQGSHVTSPFVAHLSSDKIASGQMLFPRLDPSSARAWSVSEPGSLPREGNRHYGWLCMQICEGKSFGLIVYQKRIWKCINEGLNICNCVWCWLSILTIRCYLTLFFSVFVQALSRYLTQSCVILNAGISVKLHTTDLYCYTDYWKKHSRY